MLVDGTERPNIVNISTIEEPVEYSIRVNQTNHPAGFGFHGSESAAPRPDVIMVGEIRDKELPKSPSRLVGQLLLSHIPNDSTGSVPACSTSGGAVSSVFVPDPRGRPTAHPQDLQELS
jgi:hypothetical protein